jgi:hypothetical protein
MRFAMTAAFLALTALGATPALAQSLDDIVKAEKAVDAAWQQSPLRFRQAFFVAEPPTGFGIYKTRPDQTFKVGEKLIAYAEPVGYGWKANDDGTNTFGFDIDLSVKTPDGKELFKLALTLDLTGADPGSYVLEYTARDIASDKSAVISLPFTLTK